jgi:hypothetical protein
MDKIVMDDKVLGTTNFLGWALMMVASEAAERRQKRTGNVRAFEEMFLPLPTPGEPSNSPHVFEVELKINGQEVSFVDIIKELGRQHDQMIVDSAKEIVRRTTSNMAYNFENALNEALNEAVESVARD